MLTSENRSRSLGLLILVAIAPSIGALSALWIWPGGQGNVVYAVCKLVLYGVPALVAFRTVSRTQFAEGLRKGLSASSLIAAFASGILISGLILGIWFWVLAGTTDVSRLLDVVESSGMGSPLQFWLFAAWLCIGNSLLEEFVFRWFIDSRLRGLGVQPLFAIPLSGLIFTIHHIIVLAAYFDLPVVILGSAGVFIGGMIWSVMLRRWGSLIPAWISHALVDVAIIIVGASILGLL